MLNKLDDLEKRYNELTKLISDQDIINQQSKWKKLVKEHSSLEETVGYYKEYKKILNGLKETEEMMKENLEEDMKELVKEEYDNFEEKKANIEEKLKRMLIPKDPNDEKNAVMEIRAGAGGDEAALFAASLYRMFNYYSEKNNWKTEVMSANYTDIGGIKEIIFIVEGKSVFKKLKYESGVHRVQRVPTTESGGRIHTSTATVAVLPEAEEVDVEIDPNDLRIDFYRSSGPGGQSVNTTDSAVRITHLPTEIVVSCQDEKSQHKNREKAMKILRARLFDKIQKEQNAEIAEARKVQVGTGDRSERIRTYNYPQGRVTDHRISLTLHKLDEILNGELEEIIDSLILEEENKKLQKVEKNGEKKE